MNEAFIQSAAYLPLVQTLAGGVLAFAGGVLGNFLIRRAERRAEVRNLKSAFYGEISALLAIVKRRQYIEGLEEDIREMHSSPSSATAFSFNLTLNYFNVYEKNVGNVGILPAPLPENIAMFYTLVVPL